MAGAPRTGPGGPEIRLETTRGGGNMAKRPAPPGGKVQPVVGTSLVGTYGPYHCTRRGVEAARTASGRVSRRVRMDSSGGRPSGSTWLAPPKDKLVLYRDATSSLGLVQLSDSNELPASQPAHSVASLPTSERRMSRQGSERREKVPCPKCGSLVQWQYMTKRDKNMHQGGRRRIHVCPYCSAHKPKTYSTFLDWRNHLSDTHHTCIQDGDPLMHAGYAAGFKLDDLGRLHKLEGSDTDSAY